MNTKVKWTQLIVVATLVALASVFVAGPVAALPGIPMRVVVDVPPVGMDSSTRTRFEQYNEAVNQAERSFNATERNPLNTTARDNRARFEQYLAALALMERAHEEATSASDWSSQVRFEQYLKYAR